MGVKRKFREQLGRVGTAHQKINAINKRSGNWQAVPALHVVKRNNAIAGSTFVFIPCKLRYEAIANFLKN